jgi:hypothetical protein
MLPKPHNPTPAERPPPLLMAFPSLSTSENPSPAITPTAPPTTLIHHHPRQSTETNARSLAPRSLAEMALGPTSMLARDQLSRPSHHLKACPPRASRPSRHSNDTFSQTLALTFVQKHRGAPPRERNTSENLRSPCQLVLLAIHKAELDPLTSLLRFAA